MKVSTKTIKQSEFPKATPHELHEILIDSKLHSAFCWGVARISRKVGGKIGTYYGWIKGDIQYYKNQNI